MVVGFCRVCWACGTVGGGGEVRARVGEGVIEGRAGVVRVDGVAEGCCTVGGSGGVVSGGVDGCVVVVSVIVEAVGGSFFLFLLVGVGQHDVDDLSDVSGEEDDEQPGYPWKAGDVDVAELDDADDGPDEDGEAEDSEKSAQDESCDGESVLEFVCSKKHGVHGVSSPIGDVVIV